MGALKLNFALKVHQNGTFSAPNFVRKKFPDKKKIFLQATI